MKDIDSELYGKYANICGVDEAGRGPLAGPVYAAAVILPKGFELPGLDDSKKLTEKKREALFDRIREGAIAYSIATATEKEIILTCGNRTIYLNIDICVNPFAIRSYGIT